MPKSQLKRTMGRSIYFNDCFFHCQSVKCGLPRPFQNLVGDEGFYVYQQVYPIYGLAMTLALSGLPQFISRVIAEQPDPQKQRAQIKSSIRMFLDSDWTMGNDVFLCRCYRSGHGETQDWHL